MSVRNDIALDIKEHLGEKYRIYVDNNNNEFIDIENDMTVDKQLNVYNDKITCVFSTAPGEIVALKNIYSSSFSYTLSFWVPQKLMQQCYSDINRLISGMNGAIHDRTDYRYVITFNTPYPGGSTTLNGVFYTIITLSGNISHSDKSLYGNEDKILINDQEVLSVINKNISMNIQYEAKQKEGSFLPCVIKKYAVNNLQLTLHMRKDDNIALLLQDYCYKPELSVTSPAFKITLKKPGKSDVIWETCELVSAEEVTSIGNYVILTVLFLRAVEL